MNEYASEIELGEVYVDQTTGFEGRATSIAFDLGGAQQVLLERLSPDGSTVNKAWFDVSRVIV